MLPSFSVLVPARPCGGTPTLSLLLLTPLVSVLLENSCTVSGLGLGIAPITVRMPLNNFGLSPPLFLSVGLESPAAWSGSCRTESEKLPPRLLLWLRRLEELMRRDAITCASSVHQFNCPVSWHTSERVVNQTYKNIVVFDSIEAPLQ